jgi:hypothetical protein
MPVRAENREANLIERIAFPVRVSLLLAIGVLLIGGALAFARSAHAAKPAPRTKISAPITPSATSGLVTRLTDCSEGAIGPGYCE